MVCEGVTGREPSDLSKFREEWREEVRLRQAATEKRRSDVAYNHSNSPPQDHPYAPSRAPNTPSECAASTKLSGPSLSSSAVATSAVECSPGETHVGPSVVHAVDVYRIAIRYEQDGLLDEALKHYRKAFRLDANVDAAYHREEQRKLPSAVVPVRHQKTTSIGKAVAIAGDSATMENDLNEDPWPSGTLRKLIANFPSDLTFQPDNEQEGVPLNLVPDELLLQVLRCLDTVSVARFAKTCRKALVVSLDSSIWR